MAMLSWPHGIDRFCKHYKVTRKSVTMACRDVGTTWTNRMKSGYVGPEYVTMWQCRAARKPRRFSKCPIGMVKAVTLDTTASDLAASVLAESDLAASDLVANLWTDVVSDDAVAASIWTDVVSEDAVAASIWTDIVSKDAVAATIWTDMLSDETLVLAGTNAYRNHQKLCCVCSEKLIFTNHCITDGCRMQDASWD
jgi:hypothetical protein